MESIKDMKFQLPKFSDVLKERMEDGIGRSLLHFYRKPLLSSFHWLSLETLKKMGVRWTTYRHGDTALGVLSSARKTSASRHKAVKKRQKILIIPGYGDTSMSWIPFAINPLGKLSHSDWAILDFPAYSGFLSDQKPFKSFEALKASVIDLVDSLNPDVVIGHSMGGWLAAAYAIHASKGEVLRKRKGKLQRLILINPAGVVGHGEIRAEHEELFEEIKTQGYSAFKHRMFKRAPLGFRWVEREARNIINHPDLKEFLNSISERDFLDEHLGMLRSQVSLVWGKDDSLVPESMQKLWLSYLQNASSVTVKQIASGHSPHVEAFLALNHCLNEQL